MVLPLFPSPGSETVINEPGHYKGYFCAYCPGAGTPWDYTPPASWKVVSCVGQPQGSHSCCLNCAVVLIEMNYTAETPEKETSLLWIGLGLALLWTMFG